MKNEVKIVICDDKAIAEFSQPTTNELKEQIRNISWLKWFKKTVGEKTYWKLNIDISEDKNRITEFIELMWQHNISVQTRTKGETEWKKVDKQDNDKKATEDKAEPYTIYMKPSFHAELAKMADEKHVSLSTLVMIALDNYINTQKQTEASGIMTVVDSFAEKVRVEIAKRQTKPAWVADQVNIPRSRFYSKLQANNFTNDEKDRIRRFFGWTNED